MRLACCVVLFAVASTAAPPARGDTSALRGHFSAEPPDALIHRLEPGLGFSLAFPAQTDGDPAQRWRLSTAGTSRVVARDTVTGLVLRRDCRLLPDHRILVIASTLRNEGELAVNTGKMCVVSWTFRLEEHGARTQRLTYRNDTWYGSTYWTGPGWTRVGKDWHHPGDATPSVRRFTAPRDGRVTIRGRVYKADTNKGGGDGVRLLIRHNARTIWKAEIDGDDRKGVEPELELDVRKGDAIRFVVHKRNRIFYDTTHWDPVIVYGDGERFVASEGFTDKRQGGGGWWYEMVVDPASEDGYPELHTLGSDFAFRSSKQETGQTTVLSDEQALPLLVIAEPGSNSGVVVVLSGENRWRGRSALKPDGRLSVELAAGNEESGLRVEPGQSVPLSQIVLGAYSGPWFAGTAMLQGLLDSQTAPASVAILRRRIAEAFRRAVGTLKPSPELEKAKSFPELDLWAMIQADWHGEDKIQDAAPSFKAATLRHIEKSRLLLADVQRDRDPAFLSARARQLEEIAGMAADPDRNLGGWRKLYYQIRHLKREIALTNPLLDFGEMLFVKRVPTSYSHLVMQYFGWRARPGGGIFVVERPGRSLRARELLGGQLAPGNVLEPRLSYDAKRTVFSFVRCGGKRYNPAHLLNDVDEGFYHIYEARTDGTELRQLTSGPYDDLMPTYLPDGDIVFCSTRRKGHARCFGGQFSRRWHVYTLHRMDPNGGQIRPLSFHDTNEWFPAVSNSGHILYSRWDYIDRDAVTHQNLWATRPDGTNPIALWGNATSSPHCTFQIQPIPNSAKIVFTASAHHSITAGSIAVVDPTLGENGHQALFRITPEVPFPEAESRNIREYYAAPWPLSESYFLVAYSPKPLVWEPGANARNALGLYLLDRFGNRELLYRDPGIGSTNPMPLARRPSPPVLPSALPPGAPPTGELALLDVYEGLGDAPRGSIKKLRIVQVFPKTTHVANQPPIGLAQEENARAVLGTVPVEADGSARFIVPAGKPVLFQALTAEGFAYQTMRSVTYVQPGERTTCVGCHEGSGRAPGNRDALAFGRPPSRIDPGPFGGRPFSYVRTVQPILDRHCASCHGGTETKGSVDLTGTPYRGFTRSYWALCGDRNFWGAGTNPKNAAEALVPRFGARNTVQITPSGGRYGALQSRLIKLLREGHYDVQLGRDALERIALWIDLNAIFYGCYDPGDQSRQLRGDELAMPEIQ